MRGFDSHLLSPVTRAPGLAGGFQVGNLPGGAKNFKLCLTFAG
jgi:hypothetical protein